MRTIILAAGKGTRLGNSFPKCLTPLSDGVHILGLQLRHLAPFSEDIIIVVGYKKELVMERHPHNLFVYNPDYAATNTSHSLALAMSRLDVQDILWTNGDVVCHKDVIARVVASPHSTMATITGVVGEEEVKYRQDGQGRITCVGKDLSDPVGEAVGINLVRAKDFPLLLAGLRACGPKDYFERGIQHALSRGLEIFATDVSDLPCVEVDYPRDLERARQMLGQCLETA